MSASLWLSKFVTWFELVCGLLDAGVIDLDYRLVWFGGEGWRISWIWDFLVGLEL